MEAVRMRRMIDDEGADTVSAAALEFANQRGHRVVIAVVDVNGELIQLRSRSKLRCRSSSGAGPAPQSIRLRSRSSSIAGQTRERIKLGSRSSSGPEQARRFDDPPGILDVIRSGGGIAQLIGSRVAP